MKKQLLAACVMTLGLSAAAHAQDRIKFDYWYGLTGELGEVMAKHCADFNASQTKYEAVCTGQGGYDKAEQNTIAAYRAKQHPTIVQIYDAGTLNFMLSGAVYPAKKFAEDFGISINWDDYFGGIKNYYATSKGELWSFPYNSSTAVMFWNKDEWAKIGKSEPPKTWEEFEKDAMALKDKGVSCVFAFDYDTWQNMEQFSAMHNLPIASKSNGYEGLDAELVFNTTRFVDHMKNYKKWFDAGIAKVNTTQTGKTLVQAFADGSCAMTLTSIANHGVIKTTAKPGMNWGVALMPVYEGTERKNSLVGGASLWIMDGKEKPQYEAAAAFLAYIASPEQQKWMCSNTGYIPVTNSGFKLLNDTGFYKEDKYAGRELAIASLTASEPSNVSRGIRLGNYTSVRAEIRAELEAVFTQNKDIQTALNDAVTRGNQILRRYEQTYKGKSIP